MMYKSSCITHIGSDNFEGCGVSVVLLTGQIGSVILKRCEQSLCANTRLQLFDSSPVMNILQLKQNTSSTHQILFKGRINKN